MNQKHLLPKYGESKFTCPYCQVYAQQGWYRIDHRPKGIGNPSGINLVLGGGLQQYIQDSDQDSEARYYDHYILALSRCEHCDEFAHWKDSKMIFPIATLAPMPNPDMPTDVMDLYNEAREISSLSPRAATAILRLALETLLPQVGAEKGKIDRMIGDLVSKGLPKDIERALDSLRVIGNEAVHPGTINLEDNNDIAIALFKILNMVVDRLVTQKREVDELYSLLPEGKLKGIARRNETALQKKKEES